MENILIAVLSSGVLSAMISGAFTIVGKSIDRKHSKTDAINSKVDLLAQAQKEICRDRIRHIGKEKIEQGYIEADELEDLIAMHNTYHALGGNGFCDALMNRVKQLDIHN